MGQTRKTNIIESNSLKLQSSVFQRQTTESENNTLARYKVAQLIEKDKGPFTDGKFA